MIAATALSSEVPLVTYDYRLRQLADLETIW
jgi:predicted nucleic acid-binding protein